jgi:hypothetical protein
VQRRDEHVIEVEILIPEGGRGVVFVCNRDVRLAQPPSSQVFVVLGHV